MDSRVPVKPLGREPAKGFPDNFDPLSQLVFHNGMEGGVEPKIREFFPRPRVVCSDEFDPFRFAQGQPLVMVWCLFWIV